MDFLPCHMNVFMCTSNHSYRTIGKFLMFRGLLLCGAVRGLCHFFAVNRFVCVECAHQIGLIGNKQPSIFNTNAVMSMHKQIRLMPLGCQEIWRL